MSRNGYQSVLWVSKGPGTAKTATAIASILPAPLLTLPPNYFVDTTKKLRLSAWGRISCVVTTPGTARFDLMLGGVSVWNSGALNLNIVAKTNVPWWLDIDFYCSVVGGSATLIGVGEFRSEAVVGSPLPSAGSNGSLICPVGNPAAGATFDSSVSKQVDLQHTQTVATGSIQVEHCTIEDPN
jgi:hypothetical protein